VVIHGRLLLYLHVTIGIGLGILIIMNCGYGSKKHKIGGWENVDLVCTISPMHEFLFYSHILCKYQCMRCILQSDSGINFYRNSAQI